MVTRPETNSSVPVAASQLRLYVASPTCLCAAASAADPKTCSPGQRNFCVGCSSQPATADFGVVVAPIWATAKIAMMIAYGANAFATSSRESPPGSPTRRTYAGSSTAPPATAGAAS